MRRRDFLKLSATSAVGAVIFQACDFGDWGDGEPEGEFEIESPRDIPEDYLWDGDAWFASVFSDRQEAPGIIARVFEGRVKKIEGNPNHPVNLGKLMAVGQALPQDLYHPDRIRFPLVRTGLAGALRYNEITWNDGLDQLVDILQNTPEGELLLITEPLSGAMRQVVEAFVEATGATQLPYQTLEQTVLRQTMSQVFGTEQLPTLDLENTQFLLSFGAEWLHTWIAPLQFSREFTAFRRHSEESPRGIFYHIDSRVSGTAGVADKWIPIQPGYEGFLALAIAGVIIDEGLATDEAGYRAIVGDADLPSPEEAAERTGVSAETIREMALRFAELQPSVAFGGGSAAATTNGLANMAAIYGLNVLVGTVNAPGGLQVVTDLGPLTGLERQPAANLEEILAVITAMNDGAFSTVLLHQANPVYGLPPAVGFLEALRNVENIVSFSHYFDETSVHATLQLPDQTTLESWNTSVPEPLPGTPTLGIQQPVVLRFYDTLPWGDVLLSVAEELGLADALPWTTTEEVVREQAEMLRQEATGNIGATQSFATFWNELLQTGVWFDTQVTEPGEFTAQPAGDVPALTEPEFAGEPGEFPFFLVPYEHNSLGAGEYAHLPFMQALPDPVTTVTWASWVNLNPEIADELDVETGDVVRVTSPVGAFDIQVYVNQATPPWAAPIPMGQGHAFYGRWAEGRGVNVWQLVDPTMIVEGTGALAWAATRVQIEKVTGEFEKLPRLEGPVELVAPDDYELIRVVRDPVADRQG